MTFSVKYLLNEWNKYVKENINYEVDYISMILGDIIFLSGIFLLVQVNIGKINLAMLIRLLNWKILSSSIVNAVDNLETEIRSSHLCNLLTSKKNIGQIYFYRKIIYGLEGIIVYIITFLCMSFFVRYDMVVSFSPTSMLLYMLLSILLNFLIYYFMVALTLIFQRTMTFAYLGITFLLMMSGMVLSVGGVIQKFPYGIVSDLLTKGILVLYNPMFWVEIVLFVLTVMILYKISDSRIRKSL